MVTYTSQGYELQILINTCEDKSEKHYTNSHSRVLTSIAPPPFHLQYLQHLIPAILH